MKRRLGCKLMGSENQTKISVIMGVYNQWDREALHDAVKSILHQTFPDFEFIIYDDGSDPKAAGYIRELGEMDPRIVTIGKDENHGLAFSLNACIDRAKGTYIARMDADDVALPERFAVQYEFLEMHKEYAWCGCNAELFDETGVWGSRKMPEIPDDKDYLPFSPFIHPTVMYRRKLFEKNDGYQVSAETLRCEDYEIFMRLHQAGYKGYNIQSFLFRYREDNASFRKRKFRYRVNETKLRYRNFAAMHMLFPAGWIYVIRPVIGGLLPAPFVAWLKRKEAGYKHVPEQRADGEITIIQTDFIEKSGIL